MITQPKLAGASDGTRVLVGSEELRPPPCGEVMLVAMLVFLLTRLCNEMRRSNV